MASEPTGTVSAELAKQLTYLAEEENVAHDLYVLDNKLESGANRIGPSAGREDRRADAERAHQSVRGYPRTFENLTDLGSRRRDGTAP